MHEPAALRCGHREVQALSDGSRIRLPRRQLLLAICAGATPFGCGQSSPETAAPTCATSSEAGTPGYCLVEPRLVRVAGARNLAPGEAVLANVDDNTAVIVARDDGGFHALSAICTHACCLVTLCRDTACGSVTTNPGECGTTSPASSDQSTTGIACPCHGSNFRLSDGAPTGGPAKKPLPSLALSFDGNDVLVDTAQSIDPSMRM
jgi:Rieske Fe-S protein